MTVVGPGRNCHLLTKVVLQSSPLYLHSQNESVTERQAANSVMLHLLTVRDNDSLL